MPAFCYVTKKLIKRLIKWFKGLGIFSLYVTYPLNIKRLMRKETCNSDLVDGDLWIGGIPRII